jgi:hypothetical protein
MRIELDQICPVNFRVQERVHPVLGDLVLVTPSKKKHKWSSDELHLRSVLCRPDGTIACSGFPKFRNYGEDESEGVKFIEYLEAGQVAFAEKMDGSLIIRSVIDGYVNFRTRGSHVLADGFHEPVMQLVSEFHPELLSPEVHADKSMLFEYTSPDNRVVVKYEESALTLLGWMQHSEEEPPVFCGDVHLIETSVKPVSFFELPTEISELCKEISTWSNAEGIVAWCNGGEMMIKIKAAEYLKIHSLKFHMSEERIRKIAYHFQINSMDELREFFYERGLDWEAADFAHEHMRVYLERKKGIEAEVSEFISRMEEEGIPSLPTRKRQAKALNLIVGRNRKLTAIGFKYLDGNMEAIKQHIEAWSLGVSIKSLPLIAEELAPYIQGKE